MTTKKIFSTIGFAYFLLSLITLIITYALSFLLNRIAPQIFYISFFSWALSLAPMYLVGMPVCAKWMRRISKKKLLRTKLTAKKWFSILCISLFVMYVGNIIGNLVTLLLANATNLDMTYDLQDMMLTDQPWVILLFSVLIAPILEELMFRKILIDRAIVFGDRTAIFLSGFMFGLFHGNLYQVFYAFALGCVLAYVYIRTGRLWYTILLHMTINFLGGFLPSLFLQHLDFSMLTSGGGFQSEQVLQFTYSHLGILLGYGLYVIFQLVLGILGLVRLIQNAGKLTLKPGERSAPWYKMLPGMLFNPGMGLFLAICVFEFAIGMLPG